MILDGTFRHGEAGANIVMHEGGIESTGHGIARSRSTSPKAYFAGNTTFKTPLDGSSNSSTLEWRNFLGEET